MGFRIGFTRWYVSYQRFWLAQFMPMSLADTHPICHICLHPLFVGAVPSLQRTGISLEDLYYGGRSEATPTSSADDVADDLFGSNDTARDAATTAAAAIDNEYTATPAPASSASPLGRVSVDEAAAEGDAGDEGVEAVAAELSEEASAAAAAAAEEDSAAASAAAAAEEAAAIAAAAEDAAQRELQLLDSAERRAENAYIRKCIQLGECYAMWRAFINRRFACRSSCSSPPRNYYDVFQ